MGSTAAPHPTKYIDLFQDPSSNPFGSDPTVRRNAYARIYQKFLCAAGPAAPLTAQLLQDEVLDLFEAHPIGGIGLFVADAGPIPRLRVIHDIRKYPGSLLSPSANAKKIFGYIDDVDSGRGEIVQLTTGMFSISQDVRVCTVGQHQSALESSPGTSILAPRANEDPTTEVIKCRRTFFIPFELMPAVLGKHLPPREAFLIIHPWLVEQGLDAVSQPLIDALRVAGGTYVTSAINTEVHAISHTEPGPLFRAEASLTLYMDRQVLHRDLPALGSVPSQVGPETAALTAAVSTLTDNQIRVNEANERRRAEESKPATMADVIGGLNVTRLQFLCQKESPEDLPPVYQGWTKKKKGEKLHALFQNYVDQAAREMGLQAPFVPTSVLKTFQAFRFCGVDECDLGDGILPMVFAPPGGSPTARKKQLEDATAALAYDTLVSTEGNSLNLSDALLLGKAKGYVPLDWIEALLQIKGYLPVLATIIGVDHPVVRSYLNGLDRLERIQLSLRYALCDACGDRLGPGIVVYYFQLRIRYWFEEQWNSEEYIEPPDFTKEFRAYKSTKNLNWLPVVSDVPELEALSKIKTDRSPPSPPVPKTTGKGNTGGSRGTKQGGGSSTNTGAPQVRIENPKQDERIAKAEGELGARIKTWKISKAMGAMKSKGKGPCLQNDGKEMCHSWKAKGYCYDGCKLSYDHKDPPEEESDRFWEWCQEAYGAQ